MTDEGGTTTPETPDPDPQHSSAGEDRGDGSPRAGEAEGEPVVWNKAWKGVFLDALGKLPIVASACRAAGIVRNTAYDERIADPDFAAAWKVALEDAVDLAEQEAWRRGTLGGVRTETTTQERVDDEGKVVERTTTSREVREVSDRLLLASLAAHRPSRWRTNVKIEASGPGGGPIEHKINVVEEAVEKFDSEVRRLSLVPEPEPDAAADAA